MRFMNRLLVLLLSGLVIGAGLLLVLGRCQPTPPAEPARRVLGRSAGLPEVPADVAASAIGAPMPTRLIDRLRIVSLSPAMSRVAADMGLESAIVGRSSFCDFLDPAIPVAGDLLRVDAERILALEPTHVLRQPPSREDRSPLEELARRQGWSAPITARLDDIADVRRFVRSLPPALAPEAGALRSALEARAAAIDAGLQRIVTPVDGMAGGEPGAVLLVHALRPPGVFGRGTYLDEMLRARGVANAFEGLGWRTITAEDLVRLDPAAIVLVSDRPAEADAMLADARAAWDGLGLRALRDGRLAVLAHREALRPSSGLIEVAAELDAALATVAAAASASAPSRAGEAGGA